jgi:hypothetical protein
MFRFRNAAIDGEPVQQLMVLGRGQGQITQERGEAAGAYVRHFAHIAVPELVIFCGNTSAMAGDNIEGRTPEADIMGDAADLDEFTDRGLRQVREKISDTTLRNGVEAVPYIDLSKTIGILAHKGELPEWLGIGHMHRGVRNTRLVFGPAANIRGIAAEEYGAEPEPFARHIGTEVFARFKDSIFLARVTPGDAQAAAAADARWGQVRDASIAPVVRRVYAITGKDSPHS